MKITSVVGGNNEHSSGFSIVVTVMLECRRHRKCGFDPWVGKIPWRRTQQRAPVVLPGESHKQRSLGALVHGIVESDMTERLSNSDYWNGT